MKTEDFKICIVGLGYVGLPLAVTLSKKLNVTGFDINSSKIASLKNSTDPMGELTCAELREAKIDYTTEEKAISRSNFIISAVPTPITRAKTPDLTPVIRASETIGRNISPGSIVVFESTVYPGVCEEVVVPIIEKISGLKCGKDWKIGYSPERINPGDKEHTIEKITKIVSGMDAETLEKVAFVYGQITTVYKAETIKVAEAAKVIENIQRDLNIALMNELSIIFDKLGVDTKHVLEAAGTKWNFHNYRPGLVGGHCIGVDPYYLTYKAQELGYQPQVILAGRAINDSMAKHVAEQTVKGLNKLGKTIKGSKVLVLGLTFKENVKDSRNSKVKDVIKELHEYGVEVMAHDPYLDQHEIDEEEFGVKNTDLAKAMDVDAFIVATPHKEFTKLSLEDYKKMFPKAKLLVDVKGIYDKKNAEKQGFSYLRL
jgi:UDP-N-acetyl-D-glucosamine/UDP-N-acetyl-D-galactosamine dehydrogenase